MRYRIIFCIKKPVPNSKGLEQVKNLVEFLLKVSLIIGHKFFMLTDIILHSINYEFCQTRSFCYHFFGIHRIILTWRHRK